MPTEKIFLVVLLFTEEIMDIIYPFIPTIWKNKTIEQGFNYSNSIIREMTDFFEIRIENLELQEDRKKSSSDYEKKKEKKATKKRKLDDSILNVVKYREESCFDNRPVKKNCSLRKKIYSNNR